MATIKIPTNYSKQPQTTPKNQTNISPEIIGPFIDYLSLTVSTKKRILIAPYDDTKLWFADLIAKITLSPVKFSKVFAGDDRVSFRIVIEGHKPKRHPRIAINCNKTPYVRLELNPSKLGETGVQAMVLALSELSPSIVTSLRLWSKVSRLDVAVDLSPFQMQDMLALHDQTKTCRTYVEKGQLQSIYFGKRKGNHTRIYDKTKEQQSKKRAVKNNSIRVERVLRNTKLLLSDLSNLSNPLLPLKLLRTLWPKPPIAVEKKDYMWRLFQAAANAEGVDVALKWLKDDKRPVYRSYLKSQTHDWWQTELFWKKWASEASKIASAFE